MASHGDEPEKTKKVKRAKGEEKTKKKEKDGGMSGGNATQPEGIGKAKRKSNFVQWFQQCLASDVEGARADFLKARDYHAVANVIRAHARKPAVAGAHLEALKLLDNKGHFLNIIDQCVGPSGTTAAAAAADPADAGGAAAVAAVPKGATKHAATTASKPPPSPSVAKKRSATAGSEVPAASAPVDIAAIVREDREKEKQKERSASLVVEAATETPGDHWEKVKKHHRGVFEKAGGSEGIAEKKRAAREAKDKHTQMQKERADREAKLKDLAANRKDYKQKMDECRLKGVCLDWCNVGGGEELHPHPSLMRSTSLS
jgi:hypothetical protein